MEYGRELYSSPAIIIPEFDKEKNANYEVVEKIVKGEKKKQVKTKFKVYAIEINDNKEITGLTIVNNKDKKVFFWKG